MKYEMIGIAILLIVLTVIIALWIIQANNILLDIFIFLMMLTSMFCNKLDKKEHAYLLGN